MASEVDTAKELDVVLELQGITKAFENSGSVVEVLHGIDFVLRRGELCAVTGPSGSGKSTLLNIIGLLARPTTGALWMAGEEASRLDEAALTRLRSRHLGFVFQFHHLIGALNCAENVAMPLLIRGGVSKDVALAKAVEALDTVGLADRASSRPAQLSGGQQQRVAVARALAADPALLLADEPTGNLDTGNSDAVFDLLRRLNRERGTGVIVVTHDPRIAERCDSRVEIVDGLVHHDSRWKLEV
ncbi:MAG: ABC transporter ATP-binding protein [Polyangiaceae bacterium]|nr:ABC transporter ATP-binding protein [Myxococcales bacterium]MCB9587183.1 ABC transporter ATP-binding protein [Polyangiaceae bacterium]